MMELGWLAVLTVVPLYFNVLSFQSFEPEKVSLVRSFSLLVLFAWVVKISAGGHAFMPVRSHSASFQQHTEQPLSPALVWKAITELTIVRVVIALLLVSVVSTLFSINSWQSFMGSYARLEGTGTLLSYLVLAFIVMTQLRTTQQLHRLQHAIVITSFAVAGYAILQQFGLDPYTWTSNFPSRESANAGNPIFLSAYLMMAFFVSLERFTVNFSEVVGSFKYRKNPLVDNYISVFTYGLVCTALIAAMMFSQSRGPILGLIAGCSLFVILTLGRALFSFKARRKVAWISISLSVFVLSIILISIQFNSKESVPLFQRFGKLLDTQTFRKEDRIQYWIAGVQLLSSDEPLIYPEGAADRFHKIRPIIGYGAESISSTAGRFYRNHDNQLLDRMHNEIWDALVTTGVLGALVYLAFYSVIFTQGLKWLGLINAVRNERMLYGLLIIPPTILTGVAAYNGAMAYVGLIFPLSMVGIYLLSTLFSVCRQSKNSQPDVGSYALIAILSAVLAHVVESQFGIGTAVTKTHFWILLAVATVIGMRWVAYRDNEPAERVAMPFMGGTIYSDVLVFVTLASVFAIASGAAFITSDIAVSASLVDVKSHQWNTNVAIVFFILSIALVSSVATYSKPVSDNLQHKPTHKYFWKITQRAAVLVGVWILTTVVFIKAKNCSTVTTSLGGNSNCSAIDYAIVLARQYSLFFWLVILLLFCMAFLFAAQRVNLNEQIKKRRTIISVVAVLIAGLAFYVFVDKTHISRIRADIIFKRADIANKLGDKQGSIQLYRETLLLQQDIPKYHLDYAYALLFLARGYASPNNIASSNQQYAPGPLVLAEQTLLEARAGHPLNIGITSALGDVYLALADNADTHLKNKFQDQSLEAYELAATMSPANFRLHNAKARWYVRDEQWEQAQTIYQYSLTLNPTAIDTRLSLAGVYMHRKDYDGVIQVLSNLVKFGNKAKNYELKINKQLALAYAQRGRLVGDGITQQATNRNLTSRTKGLYQAVEIQLIVLGLEEHKMGALLELSTLYKELSQFKEAKYYLETALLLRPDESCSYHKNLYVDLAEIYRQSNTGVDVQEKRSTSTTNLNRFNAAIIDLDAAYTTDDNRAMANRLENCANVKSEK